MERLLQRDLVLRVLSLVLAVVLWVMVTQAQDPNRTVTRVLDAVPVSHNLPAEMRLKSGTLPSHVRVTLSGTPQQLSTVPEEVWAFLDFSGAPTGKEVLLPFSIRELPAGVTYTVRPAHVRVLLERIATREVEVSLSPSAREQLIQDVKYRLQPTQQLVQVVGEESLVSRVARAEIIPDLTGITASGTKEMPLRPVDAAGREVAGVTLEPRSVLVHVAVHPLPPAKELPVRPRFVGTLPEGYAFTVTVQPPRVKVRGARSFHDQWTEVATEPISLTGQTQPFSVQALLVKPPGAESLDLETVTVRVAIEETRIERTLGPLPLEVRNLAGHLRAQPAVQRVTVKVRGFKRALDNLDPSVLQPHVNLAGKGPGTHLLPVEVVPPGEGIEVLGVTPETVEVTVTEEPARGEGSPGTAAQPRQ